MNCKVLIFIFLSVTLNISGKSSLKPNYRKVFPQHEVNTIEIHLGIDGWQNIQADMKSKIGNEFGKMGFPFPRPQEGARMPMPPMGERRISFMQQEPEYVTATVKFNQKYFREVKFRLKGNSSLMTTWGGGIYKLPFRLNFEDCIAPGKLKGNLYGFEKLSFSPGMTDKSLIREKCSTDILRMTGLPAAQTAFYKVFIDFGEGLKYCGIYTVVEVIEDTMIKSQFGSDSGNIYKPESNLTRFDSSLFEKKNNKKKADWSDIRQFIAILNSPARVQEPALWRQQLEAVFDMKLFVKWLAVNSTMVNWDTYGAMPHNYYLFNSPTRKLIWIPWDHDQSLGAKMEMKMPKGGFRPPEGMKIPEGFKPPEGMPIPGAADFRPFGNNPPPMFGGGQDLSLKNTQNHWILIKAVAEDSIYFDLYKENVEAFAKTIFTPEKMDALFEKYYRMITPFVTGKEKEEIPYSNLSKSEDFTGELEALKKHVRERQKAVEKFLGS